MIGLLRLKFERVGYSFLSLDLDPDYFPHLQSVLESVKQNRLVPEPRQLVQTEYLIILDSIKV